MTNVTLSISDPTYKKMKKYSEIKWSEFIRKEIEEHIEKLEKITENQQETLLCMVASEEVLKKDWENTYDDQWDTI